MTLCRMCLFKVEPSNCKNVFTQCRNNELISDMIMNFAYVEVRNIKKYTFSCTIVLSRFRYLKMTVYRN